MPDEDTLKRIRHLANIQCNQSEAAGALLVGESTFTEFLGTHIKAREAWDMGRQEGLASLRRAQFRQSQRSAAMAIWLGRIRGRPGGGYNNRARRRGTDLTEEAPRDEASRHRLAITTEWRRSLRGSAQGRPKASPGRGG